MKKVMTGTRCKQVRNDMRDTFQDAYNDNFMGYHDVDCDCETREVDEYYGEQEPWWLASAMRERGK